MFNLKHKKCKYILCIKINMLKLGVDRLSAWPIIGANIKHFTIIDIGHFQNRFADNYIYFLFIFLLLCKQTYYLHVTLFIGE